jgi:hypothetical protein
MRTKPYHFYNDLYYENFYFAPKWTAKEFKDYFDLEVGDSNAKCYDTENGVVIWLRQFDIKSLGILCHESIHAANFVLSYRGIKINQDDDEALAYLAQWIFQECMKFYKARNG